MSKAEFIQGLARRQLLLCVCRAKRLPVGQEASNGIVQSRRHRHETSDHVRNGPSLDRSESPRNAGRRPVQMTSTTVSTGDRVRDGLKHDSIYTHLLTVFNVVVKIAPKP